MTRFYILAIVLSTGFCVQGQQGTITFNHTGTSGINSIGPHDSNKSVRINGEKNVDVVIDEGSQYSDGAFNIFNDGPSVNPLFQVTRDGYVGIGKSSTSNRLDVNGSIGAQDFLVVQDGSSYKVALNGQTDGYVTGRDAAFQNKFLITSNGNSYFNGGKVGIGTNVPATLLDISSSASRAELTISGTANGAINAGVVLKATHSTNQRGLGVFMHDLGGANEWFIGRPYSGSDQFVINRRSNTSSHETVTSSLLHNTSSKITANLFTIKANGNTGIGTTSPDSKLTVKGNIHAEEVKVDLSVPGPDYVFKEDYQLRSLEEVQNYIKEHGHLPNIPSAKEMEANGIQLGEMNMKLLEKIEELTLYMLEQERKIEQLEKEVEANKNQEERISKLEKLLIKK